MKILRRTGKGGFSPQAEYIFRKQIEEADFVILNRIDELTEGDINELSDLLQTNFPGMPVLRISALNEQGFEGAFAIILSKKGCLVQKLMEVDYDVYAEGEAELGWLNAQVSVTSVQPFVMDRFPDADRRAYERSAARAVPPKWLI